MPLQTRVATPTDAPQIVSLKDAAFAPGSWSRSMFPNGTSDPVLHAANVAGITTDMAKPNTTFFIVEDTDNNNAIAGASRWHIFPNERSESEWNVVRPIPDLGPESNRKAVAHISALVDETRRRRNRGRAHVYLYFLVVAPEYQRRGIGSSLLKWGLDLADEKGLVFYLESSSEGHEMYKKFGFKDVEEMVVDCRPFGVDEVDVHYCMERQPQTTSHLQP